MPGGDGDGAVRHPPSTTRMSSITRHSTPPLQNPREDFLYPLYPFKAPAAAGASAGSLPASTPPATRGRGRPGRTWQEHPSDRGHPWSTWGSRGREFISRRPDLHFCTSQGRPYRDRRALPASWYHDLDVGRGRPLLDRWSRSAHQHGAHAIWIARPAGVGLHRAGVDGRAVLSWALCGRSRRGRCRARCSRIGS
jgi:hypothetical protein